MSSPQIWWAKNTITTVRWSGVFIYLLAWALLLQAFAKIIFLEYSYGKINLSQMYVDVWRSGGITPHINLRSG
jgi:hypothetical protein